MAKKKKSEKPVREFTKRQLSQWERQKKRQRLILVTGIVVVSAVILAVLVGWYVAQFRPMQQVVLRVDDREFNMGYYINMLEFYGANTPSAADNVVKNIQQNEAIIREAEVLGFTVTNTDVDKQLKNNKPPLSTKYRDPVRVQLVLQKLQNEYFDKQVPANAEHRHILAMFLESEAQVNEVKDRLEKGETFTSPAETLSLESNTKTTKGDLGWRPEGVLPLVMGSQFFEDQAFSAQSGVLTGPIFDQNQIKSVGYWLVRVLERNVDSKEAHVQGILLESKAKADEAKAKLDAGANFADVVKEYSKYTANIENSGDFGMVSPGTFGPDTDKFIFDTNIELRMISEPIRDETFETPGGYWLIKIDGIEDRAIDGENRNVLDNKLVSDWIDALKFNPDYQIVQSPSDDQKKFALDNVSKAK